MMRSRGVPALAGMLALAVGCGAAHAQQMYRCGNNYQDRPCDAGQKGRTVGGGALPAAAPPAAAPKASDEQARWARECALAGEQALKIVWIREGGGSVERAIAESRPYGADFVRGVWARPGAAGGVRAAVEADCVAQKEKEARARALMDAAAKAQIEAGIAPAAPAPQPVAGPASNRMQSEVEQRNEEMKRRNCARLRRELDDVDQRARRGGSASAMERFREERRDVDRRIRDEAC